MAHRFFYQALMFSLGGVLLALNSASAQFFRVRTPNAIDIVYKTPINPDHQPLFERLKKRGVLEQYKEFVSPLKLPRKVTISTEGCSGKINAWYANGKITYCYEYMAFMEQIARRGDAI